MSLFRYTESFLHGLKNKSTGGRLCLGRTSGYGSDSGFGGSSFRNFRPVYALAVEPGMCIGLISVTRGAHVCSECSGWTKRMMTTTKKGKKGKKKGKEGKKTEIYNLFKYQQ